MDIHYLHNPIIHLYYPRKRLHNHCLQFLLGQENVPRKVENNAYADFLGVKEVYCGSGDNLMRSFLEEWLCRILLYWLLVLDIVFIT